MPRGTRSARLVTRWREQKTNPRTGANAVELSQSIFHLSCKQNRKAVEKLTVNIEIRQQRHVIRLTNSTLFVYYCDKVDINQLPCYILEWSASMFNLRSNRAKKYMQSLHNREPLSDTALSNSPSLCIVTFSVCREPIILWNDGGAPRQKD